MPSPVAPRPDVTVGDPYTVPGFTVVINGSAIAENTTVKAAIASPALSPSAEDVTLVPATTCTVTEPGSGIWTATFSAGATKGLLDDPLNLGSKLVKSVRGAIDDATGYGTAKLEIQIGSPYFVTWHSTITIGKGLIA